MSTFDNVVSGKLKLKGKALDVKAGGRLEYGDWMILLGEFGIKLHEDTQRHLHDRMEAHLHGDTGMSPCNGASVHESPSHGDTDGDTVVSPRSGKVLYFLYFDSDVKCKVSAPADDSAHVFKTNAVIPNSANTRSSNYRVTGVPADGRCLFRAIAHMACLRNGESS
ncbi:unnamed protein product [Fraxinus pennsylvanica]|uniref:OTU domain-containing protein n=1 Tax=Fraxinus pennsylvanica TaxID=56036 RepID=A0AAD2EBM9_9LAMI|nr:unnamed protein product [Fraxinus pennsylvanica]